MTIAGKKRIFITGGNGYIGSVITEFAVKDGHAVHSLSRTEDSDDKLRKLGAVPVRGDLKSLDVIRNESKAADAIILLATAYTVLAKSYDEFWPTDKASMQAVADAVQGTDKPVLATTGTLLAAPDPSGAETDETAPDEPDPINTRGKVEYFAHDLAEEQNINIMTIRLSAYVYGRGGSGVKLFMVMGAQAGYLPVINGGKNHITTVHVDDAARQYLLAIDHGKKNEVYNCSTETHVTFRELSEAMADILGIKVTDMTMDEAMSTYKEFFARFMSADNRASGAKAQRELGWKPRETGILDEINRGSFLPSSS